MLIKSVSNMVMFCWLTSADSIRLHLLNCLVVNSKYFISIDGEHAACKQSGRNVSLLWRHNLGIIVLQISASFVKSRNHKLCDGGGRGGGCRRGGGDGGNCEGSCCVE